MTFDSSLFDWYGNCLTLDDDCVMTVLGVVGDILAHVHDPSAGRPDRHRTTIFGRCHWSHPQVML